MHICGITPSIIIHSVIMVHYYYYYWQGPYKQRVSCQCGDSSETKLQCLLLLLLFTLSQRHTGLVNVDCSPCWLTVVPAVVYSSRFITAVIKHINIFWSHQSRPTTGTEIVLSGSFVCAHNNSNYILFYSGLKQIGVSGRCVSSRGVG